MTKITRTDLADQLRAGTISLEQAIKNYLVTDRELRQFAYQCAHRVLVKEEAADRSPDPRLWDAVHTMAYHLKGEASWEQVQVADKAANNAAWDINRDSRQEYWASRAASNLSAAGAQTAAYWVALCSRAYARMEWETEEVWQQECLASLLAPQMPTTPVAWQDETEENLFT